MKIEKNEFPNQIMEIVRLIVRNKENINKLRRWNGYDKAPLELEDIEMSNDVHLDLLEKMKKYFLKKYPWIVFSKSQIK